MLHGLCKDKFNLATVLKGKCQKICIKKHSRGVGDILSLNEAGVLKRGHCNDWFQFEVTKDWSKRNSMELMKNPQFLTIIKLIQGFKKIVKISGSVPFLHQFLGGI